MSDVLDLSKVFALDQAPDSELSAPTHAPAPSRSAYMTTAMMIKQSADGTFTRLCQSLTIAYNQHEAVGRAFADAIEQNPGFTAGNIVTLHISPDVLRRALEEVGVTL